MKSIVFRVLVVALALLIPASALAEGDGAKGKDHASHAVKSKAKTKAKTKAKAKAKPHKSPKSAPKAKPAKKGSPAAAKG